MLKIESKHFVFKTSIAGINIHLFIDNGSKTELIDESFARTHGISTFKLKKKIKLELSNGKVMQRLDKACLVNV